MASLKYYNRAINAEEVYKVYKSGPTNASLTNLIPRINLNFNTSLDSSMGRAGNQWDKMGFFHKLIHSPLNLERLIFSWVGKIVRRDVFFYPHFCWIINKIKSENM